jgi:membrane fusion protein, heavy metal efflux system
MTGTHRLNLSPAVAAAALVSVLLVGAGGTYLMMRNASEPEVSSRADSGPAAAPAAPSKAAASAAGPSGILPDVTITLAKEVIDRAGIQVSRVSTTAASDRLRLPGVVEADAYRQVVVTPLAAGRIVRVSVQLGERVRRGQSLAQVYSPGLAEATTKYVAAKAMLDAHDRELQRTQRLVDIGAASRQELERIHAEHAALTAEVESARARLQLLGATGPTTSGKNDSDATIDVPAPIDGVVTERLANVGLNVDPAMKLFVVVDLANVWVVADVYEKDLGRVREGAAATVTTSVFPNLQVTGRVSYIDPQLDLSTRTAKARIEAANPRGELRLGMFTDVSIETGRGTSVVTVPKAALQNVADRHVVYVAVPGDSTKFIERDVRVGSTSADSVEMVSGLTARDSVVSKGSFFIRAEAERLGLRGGVGSTAAGLAPMPATAGAPVADVQSATIAVTEKGYEPAKVILRAGVPARLTVVRMTDKTCGTEIVFPSLKLKRALPLDEPVAIEFTPAKAVDIAFACGMNMLKGVVVAQ